MSTRGQEACYRGAQRAQEQRNCFFRIRHDFNLPTAKVFTGSSNLSGSGEKEMAITSS
jgi:hypothetical protein